MTGTSCAANSSVSNITYMVRNITYFHQSCVKERDAVGLVAECIRRIPSAPLELQCAQFCDEFRRVLPWVYFGISCLSLICCLGVFVTYFSFPRLRQSGYSSKVFLYRTLMDLWIALSHIIATIFSLSEAESDCALVGCQAIGVFNEIALVASNVWYAMLALDLIKAIRNPFSSKPSYKLFNAVIVWGFSILCGVLLAVLSSTSHPGEPGQSMFYWCWISVNRKIPPTQTTNNTFIIVSFFLYYVWHIGFLLFSVCVLIAALWILRGHLAASSETRKHVLKQNAAFVLVLGIEAVLIVPLWVAQIYSTSVQQGSVAQCVDDEDMDVPYAYAYAFYFTYTDFGLAIAFAVVHSLRGTVDFIVWLATFTIQRSDFKDLYQRLKKKYSKNSKDMFSPHRSSPLIGKKDSIVNQALRKNAMYCINLGILDAVQLHVEQQGRIGRVGSVREEFVAAAMMQFDEQRQEQKTAELYKNPDYHEQSLRRIQFPASSALRIPGFSFIDLEESVFNMLRSCYGIDPRNYRTSFKIKNAADIESSGMLEKFTEGKSGSFFYFTRDFKYIIKTVTDVEEKFLQKIAYRYYDHMKNNPNSLIVRFFGLHKVRLAREQRFITVVVMENIFHNTDQFKMHERYDLKGSKVGRRSVKKTSKVRREYKGTLKDLDLGDKKVHVGADSKAQLMGQLRIDVEFLIQCKIMDYSLLLGIHHHNNSASTPRRAAVREGSIGGRGDDFVDVDIHNGLASGLHRTATGSASLRSFRDRLASNNKSSGYNTRSDTNDSTTDKPFLVDSDGDIVESQFHPRREQTAWFREDFGGLRSNSPLHPLYKEELEFRGPSVYLDQEQQAHNVPPATYYFGIVDILQQYNWHKKGEHVWKTKVVCQDKHGISCVNEREYGDRFLNFMDEIFQ